MFTLTMEIADPYTLNVIGVVAAFMAKPDQEHTDLASVLWAIVSETEIRLGPETSFFDEAGTDKQWAGLAKSIRRLADKIDQLLIEQSA